MRKFLYFAVVVCLFVSCGQQTSQSSQETSSQESGSNNDVRTIEKDWHLDNPQCRIYMDSLDYNVKHKLYVRMYDDRPDADDYDECRDMYYVLETGNYIVYSRWRAGVYAYDKQTKKYFLVWDDSFHYNTKMVTEMDDGWILIYYMEESDMDGMTDAILYNLDTKEYIFKKVLNEEPEHGFW